MLKLTLFVFLIFPALLSAQSIEELRGGWIADRMGARHIYYIVLRNGMVSGTYCYDCEDIDNLSFIDDGVFDENGLRFAVYHYPGDAEPYREWIETEFIDGELHLNISRPEADTRKLVVHRTRPEDVIALPMPDPTTSMQVGPGLRNRERVLPGVPETLTPEKIVGLWLWGTGPGKQYFMFREHRGGIRGMVCGPCNSAPDIAPLEGIRIDGTNFRFDIVHEDNGLDFEEHGPHDNVTDAIISRHEMHMSVIPSFEGPDFKPIEMTLLGPIASD